VRSIQILTLKDKTFLHFQYIVKIVKLQVKILVLRLCLKLEEMLILSQGGVKYKDGYS
jgi:hypothetical protein